MPPRPIHPGRILKKELAFRDMSASRLAIELRVPANRVTRILNELCGITADTALRLARYFGNSPEFWLGLQMTHDLRKVLAEAKEIERIVPAPQEAA